MTHSRPTSAPTPKRLALEPDSRARHTDATGLYFCTSNVKRGCIMGWILHEVELLWGWYITNGAF